MKKKIVCFTLLAALTLAPAPAALAEDAPPLAALTPEATYKAPHYLEFSGKVTDISPFYNPDSSESGKLYVLTEKADGMLMNFVVDEKTVLLTENEIRAGAVITGFYLGNVPAIMIYPAQMHAELLAVDLPEGQSVKAALFDENLLSDDGQLKLNIGGDTEILLQNGEPAPADAELGDRRLAVYYSFTTRSLPAQTTPIRVIVLDEQEEEPVAPEALATDGMPLAVENVLLIDAPPVYVHDSGAVMIPLRAVAEALGYEVGWQSGVVTLDGRAVIVIGQDTYTFTGDAPVQLATAAELHEGVTYVPLNFFKEVLGLNNAYVLEQQVYIDNGEEIK